MNAEKHTAHAWLIQAVVVISFSSEIEEVPISLLFDSSALRNEFQLPVNLSGPSLGCPYSPYFCTMET